MALVFKLVRRELSRKPFLAKVVPAVTAGLAEVFEPLTCGSSSFYNNGFKQQSENSQESTRVGDRGSTSAPHLRGFVSSAPPLTLETINPLVRDCEYAVRGDIVTRAQALESQLKSRPGSLPFDDVIYCNIGNPQALGQKPITFFREVLALCDHPQLLSTPAVEQAFSATARKRATHILNAIPPAGATGAYSHSQGLRVCREEVVRGIERRDGHPSNPDDIFLTDGASPAVQMVLKLIIRGRQDGVLCPIPQYPLYSASLALNGGTLVPYYLDESQGWRLLISDLEQAVARAEEGGVQVRALCVINPGNPTGQVLSLQDQQDVVRFCVDRNLLLLADEVYQENVYAPTRTFTSFKKVARGLGSEAASLQLVSVHSASKGFYGECGRRGGYMELCGIPVDVKDALYKLASVNLCSNVPAQILMATLMNPPQEGDDAYELFIKEKADILLSLARRAESLVSSLNALQGITCNQSEGAMYAFPRLHLPPAAEAAAKAVGMQADGFYARRLLDATGIVVVPGSGFWQEPGTWHVRFTILPPEEKMPELLLRFEAFHKRFMEEFDV